MKFCGDVKGHAFIRVNAFAVEITFFRDSVAKFDHNFSLCACLTCLSASRVCNVGKNEVLFC